MSIRPLSAQLRSPTEPENSQQHKSHRKLRNGNRISRWFIGFVNQRVTPSRVTVCCWGVAINKNGERNRRQSLQACHPSVACRGDKSTGRYTVLGALKFLTFATFLFMCGTYGNRFCPLNFSRRWNKWKLDGSITSGVDATPFFLFFFRSKGNFSGGRGQEAGSFE